jgi:hypothetical protein
VIFLALFALSRWPELLPPGFSTAYALFFCAGVYFGGSIAWWLPLSVMLLTDISLDFYYQHKHPEYVVWSLASLGELSLNYVGYLLLIFLGRRFKSNSRFLHLLSGGVFGAILFYLITNTAAWFINTSHNTEYTKTLTGWLIALTKGTNGFPSTWEFFRNTLISSGLFTALFVAGEKIASTESSADKLAGTEEEGTEESTEEANA